MVSHFNRLAKAATVAAMTLGVAFAATPAQKASAQLRGAGESSTSAPNVLDILRANGNIYSVTGSGTGRTLFSNGITDYASSDRSRGGFADTVVINPFNIAVTHIINLQGFGDIPLSLEQICLVINGDITNWSEVDGPDLPVTRVIRDDSNGTYATLQVGFIDPACNNLGFNIQAFDPFTGAINVIPNEFTGSPVVRIEPPIDPYGDGNEDNPDSYSIGVINFIDSIPGALGFVDGALIDSRINAGLANNINFAINEGNRNIAGGSNYFIFRAVYDTQDQADAATVLCNALVNPQQEDLSFANTPSGYLDPSDTANDGDCNSITTF